MLLVLKDPNELWAVPPILPHNKVEPSCQLKGSPALSTQQSPLFAACRKIGEKSSVKSKADWPLVAHVKSSSVGFFPHHLMVSVPLLANLSRLRQSICGIEILLTVAYNT